MNPGEARKLVPPPEPETPEPSTAHASPDWIDESLRLTVAEARKIGEAIFELTTSPRAFADEWAAGQRKAINPLGLMAFAVTVRGGLSMLNRLFVAPALSSPGGHLTISASSEAGSIAGDALSAVGPYLHYLALAAICHGVLRVLGTRRPFRDTLGVALYAGAGPALLAEVVVGVSTLLLLHVLNGQTHAAAPFIVVWAIGASGAIVAFAAAFTLGLAGAHGMRRRWPALALAIALVGTGFGFGWLQTDADFGLHLTLGVHRKVEGGKASWKLDYGGGF